MANYYEQCRVCGTYTPQTPCYECLTKERDLLEKALEWACKNPILLSINGDWQQGMRDAMKAGEVNER